MEKQQCVSCVLLRRHFQQYKDYECDTTTLLRGVYVTGNNKTYSGLHVKYKYFCLISTESEFARQVFAEVSHIKFH